MKNLNAAEIMEMRRQAEELLKQAEEMNKQYEEQRIIAIQYHRQQLVELGAEDVQTIEITKEDTATIEMLRETIRQMNQTINDLNKEHDELYKLYLEEQREKEIWAGAHAELKEVYEQQMLDMTSEFEYEYECAINKREEQIQELKDKMEGMKFGYENQIAKLKEETNKPQIKIEVVDDPDYNDVSEEEVVNEVEEIIVPVTKEDKPVSNSPYSIIINTTHDAVKAKITVGDKVFYAAWSVAYNKPAYALVDNHKQYTRKGLGKIGLGIAYKYDKQIIADLESHRDKLLEELQDKRNKNNNRKPEPQVTKEDVIETPEEIEVPITNDTVDTQTNEETINANDEWADIDNAEFF